MKFASASLAVLMTSMRYTTSVSKAAPSRFLNPNPAPKVFVFAHLLVDIHHVMAAMARLGICSQPNVGGVVTTESGKIQRHRVQTV